MISYSFNRPRHMGKQVAQLEHHFPSLMTRSPLEQRYEKQSTWSRNKTSWPVLLLSYIVRKESAIWNSKGVARRDLGENVPFRAVSTLTDLIRKLLNEISVSEMKNWETIGDRKQNRSIFAWQIRRKEAKEIVFTDEGWYSSPKLRTPER
jgi:hypothetical protein